MKTEYREKNSQFNTGKFFLLIIAILALIINTTYSQFTWQRLYNGPFNQQDGCKDMCMATHGNFYAVGSSKKPTTQGYFIYVLKLNPYGDTIWTRLIDSVSNDALSCAESGDGGVVIVGEGHFALKLDSAGNIAWKRFYNRSGIRCYDIMKTSDGGFLACGNKLNIPLRYDAYVMKLDFVGNMIWDTSYLAVFDKTINSVIEIIGTGYLYAGYSYIDTSKCMLFRTDYAGDIIWERNLKIYNKPAIAQKIEKSGDNFLVGGGTSDSTSTIGLPFFLKIDGTGKTLSVNLLNSNVTEKIQDFSILNENRIAIATHSNVDVAKSIICDTNGNIIVQKNYPTQYYSFLFSIIPLQNGDILWGGVARFGIEDADVWIIRSDSLLNFPPIGIQQISNPLPINYKLFQNYPNPFNPVTLIKFEIEKRAFIKLNVYNVLGEKIAELINKELTPGEHSVRFEGNSIPSGVYFYQLTTDNKKIDTKKMCLVK